MDSIVRVIGDVIAPLRRQVNMMVARAVVDAVSDGLKMQGLKVVVYQDDVVDGVEHFQEGGLYHHPLPGAEGVLLSVAGRGDHPIMVGVSSRGLRPKGKPAGTTGLYTTAGVPGMKVYCDEAGVVHLGSDAGASFVALATATQASLNQLRDAFNAHMHATAAVGPPSIPTPSPGVIPVAFTSAVAATKAKAT
jgi:phage baseplate assembly protein V